MKRGHTGVELLSSTTKSISPYIHIRKLDSKTERERGVQTLNENIWPAYVHRYLLI